MRRLGLLLALSLWAAAPAQASTWSAPQRLAAGGPGGEAIPRVGISPDGTRVLAVERRAGARLVLDVAAARAGASRLPAPRTITTRLASPPAVAARPGRALVAWAQTDGLRAAIWTGRSWTVRVLTRDRRSEIETVAVAGDPRGGWVLAVSSFKLSRKTRIEALDLGADGRPAGPLRVLGPGSFGNEARPVFALAVDPGGLATLAARSEQPAPTAGLVWTRPDDGGWSPPATLPDLVDLRVTPRQFGGAVVAGTAVRSCGDAGCSGGPRTATVSSSGRVGPLSGPGLPQPGRAFGPAAADAGGGARWLTFSLKSGQDAFNPRAPVAVSRVGADGVAGPVTRLTSAQASEPVVVPLAGGQALATWVEPTRWGAALLDPRRGIQALRPPPLGAPSPFHFNPTNRDVRAAGRWVVVAAAVGDRVEVTRRRFG